ncbi:acyl-CoA reductase [Lysinibacillus sp. B2A1]|nr:acyl-CoA reductase [Lysinibacillus sp. B2A1]
MKVFWPKHEEFEQALANLSAVSTNRPFDEVIIQYTQELSKRFIRMRKNPEIVALGYWLRKANIQQLQSQFEQQTTSNLIRPRGTVFHIAPSNVDTIFVYSWMLSLLAGNRNVLRITSKKQNGLNLLLEIIMEELTKPEFALIAQQTIICTYGYEEIATQQISEMCHTRVIWGGDETVNNIRGIPLAPLATEIAFPDRFSLAALKSERVVQMNEDSLTKLIEQFYNDVFWFNQMACSSPRLVIWTGKQQKVAKARFWTEFEKIAQKKQYELLAATQVLKYTTSLQLATNQWVTKVKRDNYYSRVQFTEVPADVRELHCGGGLFYEYDVKQLMDVSHVIVDKDQTLTYFGFNQHEIEQFVNAITSRGIDRIVPIGQALNFGEIWDGQRFLQSFTREIVIL